MRRTSACTVSRLARCDVGAIRGSRLGASADPPSGHGFCVSCTGSDYGLSAETPDLVADEIESFLTGAVAGPTLNRSLAVLVFADVSRPHGTACGQRRPPVPRVA